MAAHPMYCKNCGATAHPKQITKGSIAIELMLWLFFIVPGLIYSIWRLSSRFKACPICQSPNMIPASSPIAQQMRVTPGVHPSHNSKRLQTEVGVKAVTPPKQTQSQSAVRALLIAAALFVFPILSAILYGIAGAFPGGGIVLISLCIASVMLIALGKSNSKFPLWIKTFRYNSLKYPIVTGIAAIFLFGVAIITAASDIKAIQHSFKSAGSTPEESEGNISSPNAQNSFEAIIAQQNILKSNSTTEFENNLAGYEKQIDRINGAMQKNDLESAKSILDKLLMETDKYNISIPDSAEFQSFRKMLLLKKVQLNIRIKANKENKGNAVFPKGGK